MLARIVEFWHWDIAWHGKSDSVEVKERLTRSRWHTPIWL